MQNVHFSPPQLARLFDVNVSTIKRWIDKSIIPSSVTPGGHRRTSRKQLDVFIQRFPHLAPRSYVLKRLKREVVPIEGPGSYFLLLRDHRDIEATDLIEHKYVTGTPLVTILEDIIAPTLRMIGDLWSQGSLTIVEEHRMSFRIRQDLLRLENLIPEPNQSRPPKVIMACVRGDFHELPLQMAALIFKQCGYQREILGANTPVEELLRATKDLQPAMVSITNTYAQRVNRDYLQKFIAACPTKTLLVIGGQGWAPQRLPRSVRRINKLTELLNYLQ